MPSESRRCSVASSRDTSPTMERPRITMMRSLRPMTSVMIRPGCRHRAVGRLRIINVPMPPFDPADEFEV